MSTAPYDNTVELLYNAAKDVEMQVRHISVFLGRLSEMSSIGCVSRRTPFVPLRRTRYERTHRLLWHHRTILRRCRARQVSNHDHRPERRLERARRVRTNGSASGCAHPDTVRDPI